MRIRSNQEYKRIASDFQAILDHHSNRPSFPDAVYITLSQATLLLHTDLDPSLSCYDEALRYKESVALAIEETSKALLDIVERRSNPLVRDSAIR